MSTFREDIHLGHKVPLVETDDIKDGAITTDKLADGSVTEDKLADDSVTSEKIKDGEVKTPDIADGAVTTEKIADDAVTSEKIKDGAVGWDELDHNLQNIIETGGGGGGAGLSTEWGDSEKLGITQRTLTEFHDQQLEKDEEQDETLAEHDEALGDTYRKSETYSKDQLDNLITTPNQQYVTVAATVSTTSVTDVLPETGEADTIYRVGNWDGTQYDDGGYTEYAWDGTQYIKLSVKEPGIDDEPVAGSNNLVKSGGIANLVYTFEKTDTIDWSAIYGFATVATNIIAERADKPYGYTYIPVEAGKKYIIRVNNVRMLSSYVVTAYSATIPADGTTIIPLKTISSDGYQTYDYEYIATSNGYLLQYAQTVENANIVFEEHTNTPIIETVTDLKTETTDNFYVLSSPKQIDMPDVSTWKGYCSVSTHTLAAGSASALYGFKYVHVEAGKTYKIKVSGISLTLPQYAVIVFSPVTPAASVEVTVLKTISGASSSVTYDFTYTATDNGYLMQYNQSLGAGEIVFCRLDYSDGLENTMNRISALENKETEETVDFPPIKKNVICSGSSITWGSGSPSVLDSSMVGYVDQYLKNNYAKTILCDSDEITYSETPISILNALMYKGGGRMLSGLNKSVEFDLQGDEIAICQMKRRSSDYGLMTVYADGNVIGVFDNKNKIGSNEETFTGTNIRSVFLSHPCTYNHQIFINGSSTPLSTVVINDSISAASMPDDCDAWVFRAPSGDGSTTCHGIQFSNDITNITSVRVIYNYGKIIAHERSTRGQLTEDEYSNEAYYGKSTVPYDPASPSATGSVGSGLEFRAIDERAFFIHKFREVKKRHFKIVITGGTNPYFIFNFATNRYHNLMNAGIGGWKLSNLLYRNDKINHYTQFFKYFKPDIIFEEAMTNDDWEDWGPIRRISRSVGEVTLAELQKMHQLEIGKITYNSSTDKYAVEMCTGIIDSITPTSLVSSDIVGTATQVGDIIRIGNYHGDMQQITCRRLTEVNTTTGEVKWLEPITTNSVSLIDDLSDLIGAEINIRNLDTYKAQYVDLINKVHAISPATKIVVVHNGLPNLWTRQLWGYGIIHAELAQEYNNVEFVNAQQHILDVMNWTISGSRYETVTSTGADTYTLVFQGSSKGWQGFKVLVNGVDVYGKDAYVEMAMSYRLKDTYSGASVNKTSPYDRSKCDVVTNGVGNFVLHFIRNVPAIGDTIEVQFADDLWSGDFCHVRDLGAQLYGESYKEMLDKL